jgi:hypothetical protein
LDVTLDDATSVQILFKDLSWEALPDGIRRVKPAFLHDPLREIETYRQLLAPARTGTAVCYGAVSDVPRGRWWLFLERVSASPLHEVGEFRLWQQVARWLAAFHARFAPAAGALRDAAPLLVCDADYYRLWLRRAREFAGRADNLRGDAARRVLERLARRHEEVIERLQALPATLIHGELYASNVLVRQQPDGLRVCPVDWEMAAVGPGLLDLAALTAGRWREEQRMDLTLAYHDGLASAGVQPPSMAELLNALDCCRLHLAVQWLGWSPHWSPPAEHAQDWLGEVVALSARLGL